ncbi:MAG: (2Fe-2S)-binding protein [Pseudomonadota bacterium]
MLELDLHVNGRTARATCHQDDTLLHVLRNHLDLKGTRFGCGLEQCGACTVLIDGVPRYACTTLASEVASAHVTTVEGLSNQTDGHMHPIQEAFLEEQAGQCGYCLAGMIVRVKALLDDNPAPSRTDIAAALDGNLCRCGTHLRILRAVERAARALGARGDI